MKKLSLYIFLVLIFFNFSNIAKAKEIEAFCLININDLTNSNLAKEDHYRFVGKEIHFLINFDENSIIDLSEHDQVSVLTGIYPNDVVKINKSKSGVVYQSEINVKGDKEGDIIKYSYSNTIIIKRGKPTKLNIVVDQKGVSLNRWKFKINCKPSAHTQQQKIDAMDTAKSLLNKLSEMKPETSNTTEQRINEKYGNQDEKDLLNTYKEKFFEKYKDGVELARKYTVSGMRFEKGEIIYLRNVKLMSADDFFGLNLKTSGANSQLRILQKDFELNK
ncbi:hypothetical protein IDG88_02605 [Pelagibacterales bacterium SAG-MED03]|nr:hypothetical protein [Pelagibacterales bacterium SAG-MED03]